MRQFTKPGHSASVLGLLGLSLACALGGCSRADYFDQADKEAKCLVAEKSNDPRWAMRDFTVDIDQRSRYHENYSQICPPMPDDDPASHAFMECVDGKKGHPRWGDQGQRSGLENPRWRERLAEYVELTDDGAVNLSLDSAMTLANIHSPNLQNQFETVYLSALDVSTERFRFDVRYFGGNDTTYDHTGRLLPGGEQNRLSTDTSFLMQRRFATAGELLVGFANSFVWQFTGSDSNAAVSLMNFNLVQPLLRGAGRDVALEQLTIAERGLLGNLRAFQRYRQGFYTSIAIGESGVSGPQRRGGFFGGTGLTGFTGQGAGGFGGVGGATGFGRGGFDGASGVGGGSGGSGFAGGGAGTVGGFIGLLQQLQQIRNTQESLTAQLRALRVLEAHHEAGNIDLVQVDQFRQSIETERANLLQAQNGLENALEGYMTGTLGLPPDLGAYLDDTLIRQFQFIDPSMSNLQAEISDFLEDFGDQPSPPDLNTIRQTLDTLVRLRQTSGDQFVVVEEDFLRLRDSVESRLDALTPQQADSLVEEITKLADDVDKLRERFALTETPLEQLTARAATNLTAADQADVAYEVVKQAKGISVIIDELSLKQARARVESITVQPETMIGELALDIARANRLDWMNNRAALVDTWRLIEFNADALQSSLDVVVSGNMSTTGDNPVKFRAPASRMSVGLEFDGPFTRLLERNNFRQVLIDYQRDRRRLIQYEDGVYQTLRTLLRELEELRVNLEIQRRAVAIAIRRVDMTREQLNKPPTISATGEAASGQLGPTAALDLLTALSDLRSSQNNFMSVWLNYHAARMRLVRELGTMQLDDRGIWIKEEQAPSVDWATEQEVPTPPPVPDSVLESLQAFPPDPASEPQWSQSAAVVEPYPQLAMPEAPLPPSAAYPPEPRRLPTTPTSFSR